MDILNEAAKIAETTIHDGEVAEQADWLLKINDMLSVSPDYQFVMLVAVPRDDGGVMVSQLSNTHAHAAFWMMNVAAQAIMNGGPDRDQYDA